MKTPVLFLIFNRLDCTKRVFQSIRDACPPRIYVASDGPRSEVEGEIETVQQIRNYVIAQIDWKCEVHTLFRDRNLGCKIAVSEAIDWFFKQEEQGIIIEDDCLPNKSFFSFCEQTLNLYQEHQEVAMITGTSYLFNEVESPDLFFFSRYIAIWGWATWRNRWQWYDINMHLLSKSDHQIKQYFYWDGFLSTWYRKIFSKTKNNAIDTWDIQWNFACVIKKAYCITPYKNLVRNIGVIGTRKGDTSPFINMDTVELPIIKKSLSPIPIRYNLEVDKKLFYNVFYRFMRYRNLKIFLMKTNLYFIVSSVLDTVKKIFK